MLTMDKKSIKMKIIVVVKKLRYDSLIDDHIFNEYLSKKN